MWLTIRIALTSVFPYLPEMIESFKVPKEAVSKWAGITSAVFSLSQAATGIWWGRASDRFGRKPVILCGMFGVMSTSLLFGFSKSLTWAIVARCLAGASNGNVGILRTTVAELVPYKELQPRAFSVMPLVWSIGSIFGPGFGGALANPRNKYPKVFGNSDFFKNYPFALPNIAASVLFLFGMTVGILFLKETLESKKHRRDYGRVLGQAIIHPFSPKKRLPKWDVQKEQSRSLLKHMRTASNATTSSEIDDHKSHKTVPLARPKYREVFSRQSSINLLTYSLLALHSVAYDQVLPIFMHYPPQNDRSSNPNVHLPFKFTGGFGIDSGRIGLLFTAYGVVGMLIQFFAFPPLASRYGVLPCLKAVTALFPIVYVLTPFTALCPTPATQQIAMFSIMMLKCWAAIFAFPCTTILLTNSAVSLRVLGTLNGVALSVSALGRAAGPAIAGWTFSVGVDKGYVILPWWTLSAFAILGAITPWWLVEMEGFGEADESDDDDDDISEHEDDGLLATATDGESLRKDDESDSISTGDNDDFLKPEPSPSVAIHSSEGWHARSARRISSPLGMRDSIGPGGSDKLSNGLGQTASGLGVGGTSYH